MLNYFYRLHSCVWVFAVNLHQKSGHNYCATSTDCSVRYPQARATSALGMGPIYQEETKVSFLRRIIMITTAIAVGIIVVGAVTQPQQSKAQVVVPAHVPVENSASADCEGVGASFASFPDGENTITIFAGETGQVVRSFTGPSGSVSATWAELEQTEAVEGGSTILYYFEWSADGGGRYPESGSFVFYPDCSGEGTTTTSEPATTTTEPATTTTVGATTTTVGATTTVVQSTTTVAQVTTTVAQPTTTVVVTAPPTTVAQPTTTVVVTTTVPVVQPTTTAVAVATTLPPPPTTPPALPPTGGTNTLLLWASGLVIIGFIARFLVRRLA